MPSLLTTSTARSPSLEESPAGPSAAPPDAPAEPRHPVDPRRSGQASEPGAAPRAVDYGASPPVVVAPPLAQTTSRASGASGKSGSEAKHARRSLSEYGMMPRLGRAATPKANGAANGTATGKALPPKGKGILGKSLQALRGAAGGGAGGSGTVGKRYSVPVPAGSDEGIGGVPQLRTVGEEPEPRGKRAHTPPLRSL